MTARRSTFILAAFLCIALSVACSRAPSGGHDEHAEHEGHAEEHEGEGHEEGGHAEHEDGVVELPAEAAEHASIRTEVVAQRTIEGLVETTGQVGFNEERLVHVSPRIPGRAHEVKASLGQMVEAGDVLATIDSIELGQAKAAFLQGKAQEEVTRENLEREQRLRADRISSEKDVALAKAEHREAAASLRTAIETLKLYGMDDDGIRAIKYDDPQSSLLRLRAPLPGKVIEKHVTVGELVGPEHELFVLADLSTVWIWIDVYERHIGNVHPGDGAKVRVDAIPDAEFEGEVAYVRDEIDAATRTARARIDVPNPDGKLRPGLFARILLVDPHATAGKPERLAVPDAAIQREGEGSVAFVEVGERRYEERHVTTGIRSGGLVEVLDGLKAGDKVVVEGAFILKSEAEKGSMGEGHSH